MEFNRRKKNFYYSPSVHGFFLETDREIPSDAVFVSFEEHKALFEGQGNGKAIRFNPGTRKPEIAERGDVREFIEVSPYQFRQALTNQNLRTQAEDYYNSPQANQQFKDLWEYGQKYSSIDPVLLPLRASLGLTPQGWIDLFTLAETMAL